MYILNGMLMLEQEDISDLKLMTDGGFNRTSITQEGLASLLHDLQQQADSLDDESAPADFMVKMILNEGVTKFRERLADLKLQPA